MNFWQWYIVISFVMLIFAYIRLSNFPKWKFEKKIYKRSFLNGVKSVITMIVYFLIPLFNIILFFALMLKDEDELIEMVNKNIRKDNLIYSKLKEDKEE